MLLNCYLCSSFRIISRDFQENLRNPKSSWRICFQLCKVACHNQIHLIQLTQPSNAFGSPNHFFAKLSLDIINNWKMTCKQRTELVYVGKRKHWWFLELLEVLLHFEKLSASQKKCCFLQCKNLLHELGKVSVSWNLLFYV